MRLVIAIALAVIAVSASAATTQVDGYVRKDGTYVPPHYRTTPDSSRGNNWGSQGNTNPYTGEKGTVDPYAPPPPPRYTPPRRYY